MTAQILPMHAGHAPDFGKIQTQFPQKMDTSSGATEPPTPASPDQDHDHDHDHDHDESRGRRRDREDDDETGDGADGGDATGGSRKRRRSRKGMDKKFECPHEGCGKSYSRAEHLYRHQLNHNPKQIYHCDFPECHRSFVRQDLCARHKERHTARGSQLLRKDTFMHNLNPIVTAAMAPKDGPLKLASIKNTRPVRQGPPERSFALQSPASAVTASSATATQMSPPHLHSPASNIGRQDSLHRAGSDESYRSVPDSNPYDMVAQGSGNFAPPPRPSTFSSFNGPQQPHHHSPHMNNANFQRPELRTQTSNLSSYGTSSPYTSATTPSQSYPPSAVPTTYQNNAPSSYQTQGSFPPLSTLPPPEYPPQADAPVPREQDSQYYNGASGHTPMNGVETTSQMNSRMNSVSDAILETTPSYAMPMFGGEGYSRSPFAMADDFAAWLFNDSNFGPGASPMGYPAGSGSVGGTAGSASSQIGLQAPYFNYDPAVAGYYNNPAPPSHPMAVHSILDTSLPETVLSEDKRKDLLDLIGGRFNETDHAPVKKQKDDIFEGNKDDDSHVLSLHMMQTYISSYWVHFHPQLPILHKPTFNAAACPDLLLLSIMCLGASCLEKSYGHEVTQASAAVSSFLAWHLRWEIFMDADFRPPAKLWIFQALLLLEVFEKMYSTRPLHERAHIHHATTLTLMRRGSSLIGRSAMDSPPSVKDSKGSGAAGGANSPDEWWNHWITNEATRRAAFGAFVIDSIHATMFGHSAVMVAHEMRLPLPCDEALWSATSSSEVGRVEASLHSNGIKQTTFLDGLKKTLNGQTVRTNSFGRTILMAGLLSVSWHMNQRDLQVSSLGVSQALGGRDKWRGSLTRAFDHWKQDFDTSLSRPNDLTAPNAYTYSNGSADDNIYESRTVLHHLAHMAMHVDIVDCQIYAGATRLLGRSITPQDYNGAQRRMKEAWAPTARARDATFYALRFLSNVMIPREHDVVPGHNGPSTRYYNARDDYLLNRPWVLYFATLIVWSYGYALDGPVKSPYQLPKYEDKVQDMVRYLHRVGGVRAPDDLAKLPDRNACLGLLVIMRDNFKKTRWELLHEASNLLTKCIDMLVPGAGPGAMTL
ncbi:fungal-specific transcription factor domain-containing protein [Massariosphaeria phaeospora]|uniref:Fungal-specific transcription factor domain-containing protein n=1 Tax=Massariosphaeria phaeospora TaxID=100035 RepID=A0A7C8MHH1_9PLEO|nr:fungal-specific transcription factor domain-containing protein [Massariosphaeria phaeospora]